MKYREAFAIGSVCEGTIQCTYATIYGADGKGLFSLQRSKASRAYTYTSYGGAIITNLGDDVYFDNSQGATSNRDAEIGGGVRVDLPLVYITETSDDTLVPAYLTEDAIWIITKALEKMRVNRYTIYRVADYTTSKQEKGTRVAVQTQYYAPDMKQWEMDNSDHRYHYEVEVEKDIISPKYKKLIDIISTRGTVYIKPAAFKWIPMDEMNSTIVDANGKVIKLTDALAEAEKKVARAKALLAMAGASIIL